MIPAENTQIKLFNAAGEEVATPGIVQIEFTPYFSTPTERVCVCRLRVSNQSILAAGHGYDSGMGLLDGKTNLSPAERAGLSGTAGQGRW